MENNTKRIIGIIGKGLTVLLFILLVTDTVKAQWGQCEDEYQCPYSFASLCQCESTQSGKDCYIYLCRDLNKDGCLEVDWNNPTKCSGDCEQVSQFEGQCVYESPECDQICTLGETQCVGGYSDPFGGSSAMETCRDVDGDGCGEWDVEGCEPNEQCYNGRCQDVFPPPEECIDECELLEKRCISIGQEEYRENCENYDSDPCYEWWTTANPEMMGYGLEWCEFGCDETYQGNAICMIEPVTPLSSCELGDSKCITGDDYASCVQCSDGYNDFVCNGTANTTHCEYGCRQKTGVEAECMNKFSIVPIYNNSHALNGSNNNPQGLALASNYLFILETGGNPKDLFRYDVETLAVNGGVVNITECDGWTEGSINAITGDGTYLYMLGLDFGTGYGVIGRYDPYTVGCVDTVVNLSDPHLAIGLAKGLSVTDEYIFSWSLSDTIYKFDKDNGELVDSFSDYSRFTNNDGGMGGYDEYVWISDQDQQGVIYRYNEMFADTGIRINTTFMGGGVKGIARSDDKVYWTSSTRLYEYDYTDGGFIRDKCVAGDKKCSDYMYVGDYFIRPYLLYCGDFNNDGYYEWSQAFNYSDVTGVGESCEFGCHFNTTTYSAECRANAEPNCTDIDWECKPDSWKCSSGWMYKCEDTYNRNCYDWVSQFPCDGDCLDDKQCNQCVSQCSSGDSKCFPDGLGGIDRVTQQSVAFPFPVIANCSYDNFQSCWTWDLTQTERCDLGCFQNTTGGFCYTGEQIEDNYFLNSSTAIQELFWRVGTTLNHALPSKGNKYAFSIGLVMLVVGGITVKAGVKNGGWKLGGLVGIVLIFFLSSVAWLPEYLVLVFFGISATIIVFKVWGRGNNA